MYVDLTPPPKRGAAASDAGPARPAADLGRGVFGCCLGRGGGGVCPVADTCRGRAGSVGAGLPVPARKRASLSAGAATGAAPVAGGCQSPSRRAARDGGRIALPHSARRGGRDLGRPQGAEFHRHETVGAAGRTSRHSLLADPARGGGEPECRAGTLAAVLAALVPASRRPEIPASASLASRAVSCPQCTTGRMDAEP